MGLGDKIRGWIDPPGAGGRPSPPDGRPAASPPDSTRAPEPGPPHAASTAPAATAPLANLPARRPVEPGVLSWLARELPALEADGLVTRAQADAIARRYGLTVAEDGAAAATETAGAAASAAAPMREGVGGAPGEEAAPGAPARPAPAPSLAPFLSEHAVSIVLYLGAFLVVTSVAIFLAYTWDLLGGWAKLGMVAALTGTFLVLARVCLPRPSVRPAGRTFLLLGALLVPANVAAAYTFVFADGPLPQAVFWLLGALLAGGLHAALAARLGSRGYALLAALASPVAGMALADLIGLDWGGWTAAANLALALGLLLAWRIDAAPSGAVGGRAAPAPEAERVGGAPRGEARVGSAPAPRAAPAADAERALEAERAADAEGGSVTGPMDRPRLAPLAWAARAVGYVLLPLNAVVALVSISESGAERWGPPAALLLMAGALGWDATRPGRPWVAGPLAGLVLAPFVVLVGLFERDTLHYLAAVALAGWLYAATARRLTGRGAVAWDVVGAGLALLPGFLAWDSDGASAALLASAAALLAVQARAHRAPPAAYPAIAAANFLYAKLLDLVGSPDSPTWLLGMALWPLALAWAAAGTFARPRWGAPFWAGALATAVVSAAFTANRPHIAAAMSATYAAATLVAARRLALPPLALLAVPWALAAAAWGGAWLDLERPAVAALAGATGWLFFAASLVRAPEAAGADGGPSGGARPPSARYSWASWLRGAALATAFLAAFASSAVNRPGEWNRVLLALSWADLALMAAAAGRLARSRDLFVGAALALLPAMLAAIDLARPGNPQAYAIPAGLYLLGVAAVVRRDRRQGRPAAASLIAALGAAALLLTTFDQALDTNRGVYVLLGLAEGLTLAGLGIALRWRVLVIGGVAGVVLIALRLLFDALAILPGWLLLGVSGLLLLGLAVVLLVVRDRLARAGRLVAERWAGWD